MELPHRFDREPVCIVPSSQWSRSNRGELSLSTAHAVSWRGGTKSTQVGHRWSQTEFWDYLQQRGFQENHVERQLLQNEPISKFYGPDEQLYTPRRYAKEPQVPKRKRRSPTRSTSFPRQAHETQPFDVTSENALPRTEEQSPSSALGNERFLWIAKHPRKILKRSLS